LEELRVAGTGPQKLNELRLWPLHRQHYTKNLV
jgi:hypothetical protein